MATKLQGNIFAITAYFNIPWLLANYDDISVFYSIIYSHIHKF